MPKQGRRWRIYVCPECHRARLFEEGGGVGGCGHIADHGGRGRIRRTRVEVMPTQEHVDVLGGLARKLERKAKKQAMIGRSIGIKEAAKEVRNLIEQGGAK